MRQHVAFVFLAVPLLASPARGQYLMVVDSGTPERVVLLRASDGSLVNPFFIQETVGGPFTWDTPKEVLQVGSEIWVTDQIGDAIFRFTASLSPTYIGQIGGGLTGGLDNIRGMGLVGGRVYVCNAGVENGAPGASIVVFETNGTRVTSFSAAPGTSPFDVVDFNGKLLVSDSQTHDLTLFNTNGTFDHVFHDSSTTTDIHFPQQMIVASTGAGGAQEVWAAGFSTPTGIYRFDASGAPVAYYAVGGGPRGIAMLGNGSVLFTSGSVVNVFTPPSPTPTTIYAVGSAQYVGRLDLCAADVDDGSGTGTPDGGVTIDDLLYYLQIFDQGLVAADIDDGSGSGTPDGGVTIDDLLYYLVRFDQGC